MQDRWVLLATEILFQKELDWEPTSSVGKPELGRGWTAKVEELRNGDPMMAPFNVSPEQVGGLTMALHAAARENSFRIIVDAQPAKTPRIAISGDTFDAFTAVRLQHGGSQPKDAWGKLITKDNV